MRIHAIKCFITPLPCCNMQKLSACPTSIDIHRHPSTSCISWVPIFSILSLNTRVTRQFRSRRPFLITGVLLIQHLTDMADMATCKISLLEWFWTRNTPLNIQSFTPFSIVLVGLCKCSHCILSYLVKIDSQQERQCTKTQDDVPNLAPDPANL